MNLSDIIKNPLRLALKMYILIWVFLILQIILKLTFNWWKPYVIPTEQLERLSNFIDSNRWLEIILNGILYVINGIIFTLCAIQEWWFKKKWQLIFSLIVILLSYIQSIIFGHSSIISLIVVIGLPFILNYKKWLWIILTFIFSNLFTMLSLWLEGFANTNDVNYIIKILFQFDYYIMLVLNYILFNIIRMKKEIKK